MKSLELSLNKRLLIIESESGNYAYDYRVDEEGPHPIKKICKGSELTKEIAEEFSKPVKSSHGEDGFINYLYESKEIVYSPAFVTAIESFISAIESAGYHWGENPVVKPNKSSNFYFSEMTIFHESESRTFNPEKCLIYEIF